MHFEHKRSICNQDEVKKRESLQTLFDRAFSDRDKSSLREQYKTLRYLELNSEIDFVTEPINISAIAENVTIACDILLTETDASFVFCGNDTYPIMSNSRFITKSLLNLLSNAYLYGNERLTTVKTINTSSYVKLEVQSGGRFTPEFTYGNGLNFVRQVCLKSYGNFFVEQYDYYSRATMIFPKATIIKSVNDSIDFYDLITDRLSPVYIELFGMEYH